MFKDGISNNKVKFEKKIYTLQPIIFCCMDAAKLKKIITNNYGDGCLQSPKIGIKSNRYGYVTIQIKGNYLFISTSLFRLKVQPYPNKY